jgi:hypothetical protein
MIASRMYGTRQTFGNCFSINIMPRRIARQAPMGQSKHPISEE